MEAVGMEAVVAPRYGAPEVLEVRQRPLPVVGPHDVLVRVHAAGVNPADLIHLRGEPMVRLLGGGLRRPRRAIPGSDVAGRVAAVGAEVTTLRPGDAVFADLSGAGRGAFAQFVSAPAASWVRLPDGVDLVAAGATPMAAATALQGLRDHGRLRDGQRVLVHGASGGVGTFAVQLARAMGARVTAVSSARNHELVRSLGADHAVDYLRQDALSGEVRYDLIFDTVGNRPLRDVRRALAPDGAFVTTALLPALMVPRPRGGRQRLRAMFARPDREDLARLAAMLADGTLAPVVERRYPLRDAREALDHVAGRHARGKVVLVA